MKNWFEQRSTTNVLLFAVALLLGFHLLMNLPMVPSAKAQLIKTTELDYLKSMDKNIEELMKNSDSMRADIHAIQNCIVTTPVGGHAIVTKSTGLQ